MNRSQDSITLGLNVLIAFDVERSQRTPKKIGVEIVWDNVVCREQMDLGTPIGYPPQILQERMTVITNLVKEREPGSFALPYL